MCKNKFEEIKHSNKNIVKYLRKLNLACHYSKGDTFIGIKNVLSLKD